MKSRVLMAALVVTLVMGTRSYANECGPCDQAACDPCAVADDTSCAKSCDLFSGLKKLVKGIRISECNPCDGVVACNPCDEADKTGPCDEVGCNDSCLPKFELGKRLRNFLATRSCLSDCNADDGTCNPCDVADTTGPCDEVGCNDSCLPKISLRNLFKRCRIAHCNANDECGPCDNACDVGCDDAGCDTGCIRGHLLDLPRLKLHKLFDGLCVGKCNPCDQVECNPCDNTCVR